MPLFTPTQISRQSGKDARQKRCTHIREAFFSVSLQVVIVFQKKILGLSILS
jgi:hypothetical protein